MLTWLTNVAHQGGAFYVSFFIVLWAGETKFIANNASSSGGAVHVASSPEISIGEDTYFTNNEAGEDGDYDYDTPSFIAVNGNT